MLQRKKIFRLVFFSSVAFFVLFSLITTTDNLDIYAQSNDVFSNSVPANSSLFTGDYLLWSSSGSDILEAIPISTVQSFIPGFSQQAEYINASNTPNQIVLSKDGKRAYISSTDDNILSIVNLISKTVETTITVGVRPHRMVLSSDEKKAYVINRGEKDFNTDTQIFQSVSIVNLETNVEERQIPLGAPPDNPYVFPDALTFPTDIELSSDEKTAYITDSQTGWASVIYVDLTTYTVTDRIDIYILGYSFPVEIVRSNESGIAYIAGGSTTLFGLFEDWWIAEFDLELKQPLHKINLNRPCDDVLVLCDKINPRGLSLSPDGTKAYVASNSQGRLIEVDLEAQAFSWSVEVGEQSEDMALSEDGKKAYVVDSSTDTLSVVDIGLQRVVGTVDIGRKPFAIAAKNNVGYITNMRNNSLSIIDLDIPSFTDQILAIDVGRIPKDINIAPGNRYAYISNLDSLNISVVDLVEKKELSTLETEAFSHQFSISPDGKFAYIPDILSSGAQCEDQGIIQVYNLETQQLAKSLPADECPFAAIAVSDTVYATSFGKDQLTIIDSSTQTITGRIRTGLDPGYFAITRDGKHAYVANSASKSVSVLDLEKKTRTNAIQTGEGPRSIELSKDESKAYIANFDSGTLSILDLLENRTLTTIKVGKGAFGVALSPDEKYAYVTSYYSNSIFIVDLTQSKVVLIIPTAKEPLRIRYVLPPSPDAKPLPTPTGVVTMEVYLPLIQR